MWSLEAAILYRLNFTERNISRSAGASISNTENSATLPDAKADAPLLVIMTSDSSTEAAVRSAFKDSIPGLTVATIVINGTARDQNPSASLLLAPPSLRASVSQVRRC